MPGDGPPRLACRGGCARSCAPDWRRSGSLAPAGSPSPADQCGELGSPPAPPPPSATGLPAASHRSRAPPLPAPPAVGRHRPSDQRRERGRGTGPADRFASGRARPGADSLSARVGGTSRVRLRDEHGLYGGYTMVKDHVRTRHRTTRETFVPLPHPTVSPEADSPSARGRVSSSPGCASRERGASGISVRTGRDADGVPPIPIASACCVPAPPPGSRSAGGW